MVHVSGAALLKKIRLKHLVVVERVIPAIILSLICLKPFQGCSIARDVGCSFEREKIAKVRTLRAQTIFWVLSLLVGLLGCSQTAGLFVPPTPTPAASAAPGGVDAARTPLPYESCGWAWANQDLPEVTSALRAALAAAELPFDPEGTYAYAFGENCLRPDGEVDHFATKETDFVVTTAPPDTADLSALGKYAAAVLGILLKDFSPGAVPGPQHGQVDFVFVSESGAARHQVLLTDAAAALQNGLTGAALYQALFR